MESDPVKEKSAPRAARKFVFFCVRILEAAEAARAEGAHPCITQPRKGRPPSLAKPCRLVNFISSSQVAVKRDPTGIQSPTRQSRRGLAVAFYSLRAARLEFAT